MKEPTYKQLQQRLKQAKSDYRFMASEEIRCYSVEESLKKEIYSIGAELKKIDELEGDMYSGGGCYRRRAFDYKKISKSDVVIILVVACAIAFMPAFINLIN